MSGLNLQVGKGKNLSYSLLNYWDLCIMKILNIRSYWMLCVIHSYSGIVEFMDYFGSRPKNILEDTVTA